MPPTSPLRSSPGPTPSTPPTTRPRCAGRYPTITASQRVPEVGSTIEGMEPYKHFPAPSGVPGRGSPPMRTYPVHEPRVRPRPRGLVIGRRPLWLRLGETVAKVLRHPLVLLGLGAALQRLLGS